MYSWWVPFTAFGQLKIVASQDIGELGPKEGAAVVYNWKWYYSIPGMALWVVLLGAIVLVKANRNPHALLIILPLLVLNLLWLGFVKLLNFPPIARVQYDPLFASYTAGIAVLWLLAHKLGNRKRLVTFFLALLIMIVVGFGGLASYSMSTFSYEIKLLLAFLTIFALAVLVGFVLTALLCRKHYNSLRFILWLAFWTVINSVAAILTFMVIMFIVRGRLPSDLTDRLLQVYIAGLVIGLLLYVINLSFIILVLNSSFYRERFFACLRLKSMSTSPTQTNADQPNEQNLAPKTTENGNSI